MALCKKCDGKRIVRVKDKWQECSCVLEERYKTHLSMFLPAPKNVQRVKSKVDRIISSKRSPKRVLIDKLDGEYYKTLFIYYLVKTGKVNDFACVTTYNLIDLYLGNVEEKNLYDFVQGTIIILHGFSDMGNKQEYNIMNQFIDIYRDRNILAYSHSKDRAKFRVDLISRGFVQV